jgi:hypothetical protein
MPVGGSLLDVEAESGADILNYLTLEKAAGYQWILQGCESCGPVRSNDEMDN